MSRLTCRAGEAAANTHFDVGCRAFPPAAANRRQHARASQPPRSPAPPPSPQTRRLTRPPARPPPQPRPWRQWAAAQALRAAEGNGGGVGGGGGGVTHMGHGRRAVAPDRHAVAAHGRQGVQGSAGGRNCLAGPHPRLCALSAPLGLYAGVRLTLCSRQSRCRSGRPLQHKGGRGMPPQPPSGCDRRTEVVWQTAITRRGGLEGAWGSAAAAALRHRGTDRR